MGRPKKPIGEKFNKHERVKCTLCGRVYTKNNAAVHRQSLVHQAYAKMETDIQIIMSKDPDEQLNKVKLETVDDIIFDGAVRRLRKKQAEHLKLDYYKI